MRKINSFESENPDAAFGNIRVLRVLDFRLVEMLTSREWFEHAGTQELACEFSRAPAGMTKKMLSDSSIYFSETLKPGKLTLYK